MPHRHDDRTYWERLVAIAIKYGIDLKHIPAKATPQAEKDLYLWFGHAVVQREMRPKKKGRPKGSSNKQQLLQPTAAALSKAKSRDDLCAPGISDAEWNRRFDRRQARKRPDK